MTISREPLISTQAPSVAGRRHCLPMKLVAVVLLLGLATASHAVVFKIATLSPDGSIWMKVLREGAKEVAQRTSERVTFKFYPGGVMGDDKAVLRKIRVGQLHGAVLTAGGLNQVYPDLQLYTLPMLFRDLDEVDAVRAQMDPVLMKGLREAGYVGFGISEVGFAYSMSKTPVATYEDVKAQKVWIPDGDQGAEQTVASFDITPIPLSIADVLSGLQTGLINSVAVPPVGAIALQWHTQLQHVYDLPLMYVYGLLAINDKQFDMVDAADQAVVLEVMSEVVRRVNDQNRIDHERAVEVLKNQGLVWAVPDPDEAERWQGMADTASRELVEGGIVSETLYEQLLLIRSAYREGLD